VRRVSVRVERSGSVWTVVLARPERRNAVDAPTAAALAQACRDFDSDPGAAVAVLWGEGGHFCAGADLLALGTGDSSRLDDAGDGPLGPTRLQLRKPVIAAVEGYAVAGGLELAIWCDLRVAAEDAVFGVFCRRWGVPLVDGGTVRLPRIVGVGRALDLILTGRPLAAPEAHAWGLVDRLVPPGQARAQAEALAVQIAAQPQDCLRNDRESVYRALDLGLDAALAQELRLGRQSLASPEVTAGVARFRGGAGRHGE